MKSEASQRSRGRVQRAGFTMLEIVSVVFVIGLMVGLLLPAIQSAREAARRASCGSRLAQIGFAVHAYQRAFEVLPAGTISEVLPVEDYPNGYHHSWLVRILPMLDQRALAEHVDWRYSCYDPVNWPVGLTDVQVTQCPSDWIYSDAWELSSYAGVFDGRIRPLDDESRGLMIANRFLSRDDVPDGFAYTLLAGEKVVIDSTESDLGWTSGTRATLRTTGYTPAQEARQNGDGPRGEDGRNPRMSLEPYGNYLGDAEYDPAEDTDAEDAEQPDAVEPKFGDFRMWEWAFDEEASRDEPMQFPAPTPQAARTRPGGFDSRHAGGTNMLWGDGRVAIVNELIDAETFSQMGMRDDGMPIKPLLDE